MQVAGIGRKLTFQPATGDSAFDEFGYGVNVTGTFHPWACMHSTPRSGDCATPMSKSRFLWQFAAGRGISRYIQDVNGLGLDATFDPANGFRTIPGYGWFVAYEQWWGKNWASNFTYGQDAFELTDTLPGNTYQRANYVSANLIWLPVDRMGVGLEYLYGFRREQGRPEGRQHPHPDGIPVQVLRSRVSKCSGAACRFLDRHASIFAEGDFAISNPLDG